MAHPVFSALANQNQAGGQCEAGSHWEACAGFPAQNPRQAWGWYPQASNYPAWRHAQADEERLRHAYYQAVCHANLLKELCIETAAQNLYDASALAQTKVMTLYRFWFQAGNDARALWNPYFQAQYEAESRAQHSLVTRTEGAPPPAGQAAARIPPATVTLESVGAFRWLSCLPPKAGVVYVP